ncbi:ATP-binding cassette domain-containing protein [Dactylosporangium sp. CA-233914]|uniref:ATP-binding cassette domain-containing protein n=1 Tax=Dactylosporangium sp. CA-233914 TaxID=3239934 RepID=UPI003D8D9DBE
MSTAVDESCLVVVEDLVVEFPQRGGGSTRSVDGVSLRVREGESFGLVGESGSGKTTTARAILRLCDPARGTIRFDGRDITRLRRRELRALRREMQLVYQDPQASLDPRMTVRQLVEEALLIHDRRLDRAGRLTRVRELLAQVGLGDDQLGAKPGSLSGGQLQRVAIARALAPRPRLLVCDEVVSALDVSVQAQILNLLKDLQQRLGLTLIFISHDLGVISYLCDRVAVMLNGRIVELGPTPEIIGHATQEYTRELILSCPDPDPRAGREARRVRLLSAPTA